MAYILKLSSEELQEKNEQYQQYTFYKATHRKVQHWFEQFSNLECFNTLKQKT